ncbi:CLUMA_CG013691, isoform A [Clunio marinus]|uniref:CLUMA_CG013691, isoform A n=1 Tax=Clunio marinus TaxID=568069 RepID=A0A1J1IPK0_9DIPT|nr:CLUMA_CG013691, isoform A [Clunio marinus]
MYDNVTVVRKSMSSFNDNSTVYGDMIYNSQSENDNNTNATIDFNFDFEPREYIFDRKEVRIIFITLYTMVFCCCFFGNLLVILVVTLSRRLRSITNFFLANLAVADFCVGIFCVFQNLSMYLIDSWVFGSFLCKAYHFIHSLSYTASIFILVVICMERYLAIQHPITSKQILTSSRLKSVIVLVWWASVMYSIPKFIYVETITNKLGNETETICTVNRRDYNVKLFDILNFIFLYLLPLMVMTVLYSRIAISLWKSSKGLGRSLQMKNTTIPSTSTGVNNAPFLKHPIKYDKRALNTSECEVSMESDRNGVTTWRTQSISHSRHNHTQQAHISTHSTNNVLRARRGVVRMLMVVVLTFALCNLPLHARKILLSNRSQAYRGDSNFNALFTPLTFLATYFNSGINPLLYAILSRNFRKGMSELLICSLKQNKNKALNKRATVTHNMETEV